MNTATSKAIAVLQREIKGCLILLETIPTTRYDEELLEVVSTVHDRLAIASAMFERTMTQANAPRRHYADPNVFCD